MEEWVEALAAGANDLEAPAMRIQPVIGEVHRGAQRHQWRLARADVGLGRDLFAIYENTAEAQRAAEKIRLRAPRMVGACGGAELEGVSS